MGLLPSNYVAPVNGDSACDTGEDNFRKVIVKNSNSMPDISRGTTLEIETNRLERNSFFIFINNP